MARNSASSWIIFTACAVALGESRGVSRKSMGDAFSRAPPSPRASTARVSSRSAVRSVERWRSARAERKAFEVSVSDVLGETPPELDPEDAAHFRALRDLPPAAVEELKGFAAYLRQKHAGTKPKDE